MSTADSRALLNIAIRVGLAVAAVTLLYFAWTKVLNPKKKAEKYVDWDWDDEELKVDDESDDVQEYDDDFEVEEDEDDEEDDEEDDDDDDKDDDEEDDDEEDDEFEDAEFEDAEFEQENGGIGNSSGLLL